MQLIELGILGRGDSKKGSVIKKVAPKSENRNVPGMWGMWGKVVGFRMWKYMTGSKGKL